MLLKRFSIRQVTIAGTLISAVGFIASTFAPNVFVLIIMYGVVGGKVDDGLLRGGQNETHREKGEVKSAHPHV